MHLDDFVFERLFREHGSNVVAALVFPAAHVEEVFVVALSFAFFSLVLFAEVTTARLLTVEGIVCHEFTHKDEVFETKCLLEFHVHAFLRARDAEFLVESLAELLEQAKTLDETFLGATHTHVFPHDVAEFLVDAVHAALTTDSEEAIDAFTHVLFCSLKFGEVGREARNGDLVSEVV